MRHELSLTVILVILLLYKIFYESENVAAQVKFFNILLFLNLLVGLIPSHGGELFGGMYAVSSATYILKNILNLGVFIIGLQANDWLVNRKKNVSEFFMLIVSTLMGLYFMVSTKHFLMFYIGLELATIPVAALAAFDRTKSKSAESGFKLIILSAFSSGILLFGLSILYGTTGSMYFSEMTSLITGNPLQLFAFIFVFAGFAFKISAVPFHLWTADVYEGAPVVVTSYLSVISKGATVFILAITLLTVFSGIKEQWLVLYATTVLTITVGNLFAMRQTNLKRFLAFSSIAQAGYLLMGMMGGAPLGLASVVYFVLVYIFSNLGAFGVVSVISEAVGKEDMSDYRGLYKTNPNLSLVMMLSLFSLAGIPPVAGFFGKFFLFTAAAQKGYYILVLIAALNTIISLYYYLLVVKAMFIEKTDTPIPSFTSSSSAKLGLILCTLGILLVGIFSGIFETIFTGSIF